MEKALKMTLPCDTILGIIFLFLVCVGFLGNSLLFMLCVYTFFVPPHLKTPIDRIIVHLTLVNGMTILFRLLPDITAFFGVRHFMGDVGCKTVSYIYRVTRGFTTCSTSLLSAFQAINISPSNSKWAWLKSEIPTHTVPSFCLFWTINVLIYIPIFTSLGANSYFTVTGSGYQQVHWKAKQFDYDWSVVFVSAMVIRGLLFVVLMLWTVLTW